MALTQCSSVLTVTMQSQIRPDVVPPLEQRIGERFHLRLRIGSPALVRFGTRVTGGSDSEPDDVDVPVEVDAEAAALWRRGTAVLAPHPIAFVAAKEGNQELCLSYSK